MSKFKLAKQPADWAKWSSNIRGYMGLPYEMPGHILSALVTKFPTKGHLRMHESTNNSEYPTRQHSIFRGDCLKQGLSLPCYRKRTSALGENTRTLQKATSDLGQACPNAYYATKRDVGTSPCHISIKLFAAVPLHSCSYGAMRNVRTLEEIAPIPLYGSD